MFWKKIPEPGHNDIFALFKRGKLTIEGDLQPFMANLLYIKDVLAAPRRAGRHLNNEPALRTDHRPLSQSRRCSTLRTGFLSRRPARAFRWLCLHTAGSDGRQFRGLLNDKRVTDNYRVIVFDMPWHGKSLATGLSERGIQAHLARLHRR